MPSNPYSPPTAVISQVPLEETVRVPPEHVKNAVRLLWVNAFIGLAIQVTRLGVTKPGFSPGASIVVILLGCCVGVALVYWVARKLSQGRNWMRMILLVFTVLGLFIIPFLWRYRQFTIAAFGGSQFRVWAEMVRIVIGWFVVALLFTVPSRAWFRHEQ
jgi:uncharacterized protein YqgC (DUF456 family)